MHHMPGPPMMTQIVQRWGVYRTLIYIWGVYRTLINFCLLSNDFTGQVKTFAF